jgi:hypothetical protein
VRSECLPKSYDIWRSVSANGLPRGAPKIPGNNIGLCTLQWLIEGGRTAVLGILPRFRSWSHIELARYQASAACIVG